MTRLKNLPLLYKLFLGLAVVGVISLVAVYFVATHFILDDVKRFLISETAGQAGLCKKSWRASTPATGGGKGSRKSSTRTRTPAGAGVVTGLMGARRDGFSGGACAVDRPGWNRSLCQFRRDKTGDHLCRYPIQRSPHSRSWRGSRTPVHRCDARSVQRSGGGSLGFRPSFCCCGRVHQPVRGNGGRSSPSPVDHRSVRATDQGHPGDLFGRPDATRCYRDAG